MKITICDRCKRIGSDDKINHWIELRFSEGLVANFFGSKNKTIELCAECYEEFVNYINKKKKT